MSDFSRSPRSLIEPPSTIEWSKLRTADEVARAVIDAGTAHACAVGWAKREASGRWRSGVGGAESLFDLASVTKPMTAIAIARTHSLREATLGGALDLARGTASADTTIETLLAHRAGLLDHMPLYLPIVATGSPDGFDAIAALRTAADGRRAECTGAPPAEGFAPVYSDLGYALAGAALAASTRARDAGEAIAKIVVAPLGLEDELGTARELFARGIDPTRAAEPTEDVAWRGGVIRGRVHDENAWALTGLGGSGHAGMFGTARAVVAFAIAAFDAAREHPWLVAPRPGGTLRAGFDGKSESGSSAGELAGPRTFGHLGFTGTSMWIDPDAEALAVVLTNRVYPTRNHAKIREIRPRAHDALFAIARASV